LTENFLILIIKEDDEMNIPILETDRLILRPLTINDVQAVFEWTGDERVAKYMIYPCHKDIEVTKEWLSSLANLENEYTWGFELNKNHILIGSGGIRFRPDEECWSFGYNIRYDCWNNGYATEAVKKIIEYAYNECGARNFCAEHAIENIASGRVIEKCGLNFVGYSEYSKFDGSEVFKCKKYRMILK